MKRSLSSGNVSQIDTRNTHPVVMVKLLFDTPAYVHSGLGNIVFESNTYLGVGNLGGISGLEETEALVPAPILLSLDGLKSEFFDEALNAANFGDKAVLYWGYRDDTGDLVDDPWVMHRGRVETSRTRRGKINNVVITVQHELAVLNKRTGTKYTDEEQQRRYPSDNAFSRIEQMSTVQLTWGRKTSFQGGGGRPVGPGPGRGDDPHEEAR